MTKRLIAVGRKVPAFPTQELVYAIRDPEWSPKRSPKTRREARFPKPDYDLIRKQRIEDAIALGEGE